MRGSAFHEEDFERALLLMDEAIKKLPTNIFQAVEHWLMTERLKRRHGEQPDDLDVSWIPGLIQAFDGYTYVVID